MIICSGGQSGADLASLKAAKACGISTKGFMTRGFMTENGAKPEYASLFNMVEVDSDKYPVRTEANVLLANATFYFRLKDEDSPGYLCTKKFCRIHELPFYDIVSGKKSGYSPKLIAGIIELEQYDVVNVAGSRESVAPGIEKKVYDFWTKVFKIIGSGE